MLSFLHIGIVGIDYLGFDDSSTFFFLLQSTYEDIWLKFFFVGMTHA